jgi:hypothetical protein
MTGRPTGYSDELAMTICEKIATTPRGLDYICAVNDELPSASTVHRWLNEHPTFCESYLRARERQADLLFDECLEIADDGTNDTKLVGRDGEQHEVQNSEWISRSKLRVETRMRMAGKLAPKKYGDKVTQELTGPGGVPLTDEAAVAARLASILSNAAARKGETA